MSSEPAKAAAPSNGQEAIRRLLGDVKPLPFRVAAEVAWKSIKVRLSRSLVTVSSVVLAVAFLMTVLCGDVVNRAVLETWTRAQQPLADLAVLHAALAGPRSGLQFLGHLAEADGNARLAAWSDSPLPTTASASRALEVVRWLERLKATDRYQLLGNREPIAVLELLEAPAAVDAFLTTAASLRGTRLPLDPEALRTAVQDWGDLRRGLAALSEREAQRLAGLTPAVRAQLLADIDAGTADPAALIAGGVPLDQDLPGFDAARLAALRQQLQRNNLRQRAHDLLSRFNTIWSSGRPIELAQVWSGELEQDPRRALLVQDFATEVGPDSAAVGKQVAAQTRLSADAERTRQAMLGVLKSFNQTFAGRKPVGLSALADGSLGGDRRMPLLETELIDKLGAAPLEELRVELRHLTWLSSLEASLQASGIMAEDGTSTFWLLVLSLLVCVVGIVNSMMMAVTERFREIATMKCLGAMDGFIMKTFLLESGSIGAVGALAGVVLGLAVVVVQAMARYGGAFWTSVPVGDFSAWSGFALLAGLVLTITGALLPAWKAARMHPIEAMRLEA